MISGKTTYLGWVLILLTILPFTVIGAESKSGVDPQVISLPTGPGSIEGLGESFEPNLNTGTATYGVKIAVSPGVAGCEPTVQLVYNSGNGNSALGLGWDLNLEYIQRQTDKGLPSYSNDDIYIYSGGGELVPLPDDVYRLKIESSFTKFKKVGNSWEAWRRDGTHLYFGTTTEGQQQNNHGIFSWYLQKEIDTNGNEIHYLYSSDQSALYLQEIRYTVMSETIYKSVHFIYETRHDPFTNYVSRAKVTTAKRLRTIEVRSKGELVRKYHLAYLPDTIFSLLGSVTQYGNDGVSSLPPISFEYSVYDPGNMQSVVMTDTPPAGISPANNNVDLIDINGDTLPDVVHTDSALNQHTFYINNGNGSWQQNPVIPGNSPPHLLATDGVMMSDMNGDGLADLFIKNDTKFGYFQNKGNLYWEDGDWTSCTPNPGFSFESQEVRLLDLNNDKLIDVLIDNDTSYLVWFNHENNQWNENFDDQVYLPNGSHLDFSSAFVKMGDMNGDRMQDLVYALDGYLSYFPSMGNGWFDEEVVMSDPPIGLESPAEKLTTSDIDNNGLSDIALIGNEYIKVWFNIGNNNFAPPITFTETPPFQSSAVYRFADMNGDGFTDLLITDETAPDRYIYVDFNNGVHPNLLTKIANGLGRETTITYKSFTEDYLADQAQGQPWSTTLPFPIQVVAGVTVTDLHSGHNYISQYHYRNGYYDGHEKEFRGFGAVRKIELGGAGAPSLLSLIEFDTGKTEESRKGLITMSAALSEDGTLDPINSLFDRQDNTFTTNTLHTGLNGELVRFSYIDSSTTTLYEQTTQPVTLYKEIEQDNYGNTVKEHNYGIIEGSDYSPGQDEILTGTNYLIDEVNWMVNRPVVISVTDLGNSFVSLQHNFYDQKGNLTREERSPEGTTFIPMVRNEHDQYGNITKITDANDHCRDILYDNEFHTFPEKETICGLGLQMNAAYDRGLGKITKYTDFNGHGTSFVYDPLGRLISIIKPGDSPLLPTQSFEYFPANPLSHVTSKSREQSGTNNTYDTITYYDGLGRKLQTRSEGGVNGWVVSEAATYNQRGEIAQKWLPYFSSTSQYQPPDFASAAEFFTYDAKKRVIKQTNPDDSYQSTNFTPLTKTVYDEEDNGSGVHADTPHTYITDGLDRLIEVLERNSTDTYTTEYRYDGLNNLVWIKDNEDNIKTMEFNGLGRKTSMDDPDKHHMSYGYDLVGNLVSTTDAKSQTVIYSYDAANRPLTEEFNGTKVRYHYDGDLAAEYPDMKNTLGRLSWVEDEAGRELFSYNPRGKAIVKIREVGGKTFHNGMSYDGMDRLTALTYPDGFTVNYSYNERNLLNSVPGFVTDIDYNAAGRKTRFEYANGLVSNYQYDQRQRMKILHSDGPQDVLQDLSYIYDNVGNITSIIDGRISKTPEDRSRTFQYDDLYRLTGAVAPDWTRTYGYSSIGNMIFKSDIGTMTYGDGTAGPHAITGVPNMGLTYTYDLNGNIAAKAPGFSYQFDHRDRLTEANRESDNGEISYQYDYQGNRKIKTVHASGETAITLYADQYTELRKDTLIKQIYADNRLVARISSPFEAEVLDIRTNPLSIADFDLNPTDGVISLDEIREQGKDPSVLETEEASDGLRIFYDNLVNNPDILPFATIAAALHELGDPAQVAEGSIYYYLPDHLGSPAIITDVNGSVVEESIFYPYGQNRTRTGTFTSEYRFTGKELDDETGLHYFEARYYDSLVGRFVSVDPLYAEISTNTLKEIRQLGREHLNVYMYVSNNPIIYYDIKGLFKWGTLGVAASQTGAALFKGVVGAGSKAFAGGVLLASPGVKNRAKGASLVVSAFSDFNEASKYASLAGENIARAFGDRKANFNPDTQEGLLSSTFGQLPIAKDIFNNELSKSAVTINNYCSDILLLRDPTNISKAFNMTSGIGNGTLGKLTDLTDSISFIHETGTDYFNTYFGSNGIFMQKRVITIENN